MFIAAWRGVVVRAVVHYISKGRRKAANSCAGPIAALLHVDVVQPPGAVAEALVERLGGHVGEPVRVEYGP